MASSSYTRIVNNSAHTVKIKFVEDNSFRSGGWSGNYSPDIQFETETDLGDGKILIKPLLYRSENDLSKKYTLRIVVEGTDTSFSVTLDQKNVGNRDMKKANFYKEDLIRCMPQQEPLYVVTQTSSWRNYENSDFGGWSNEFRGVLNVYITPVRSQKKQDNTIRMFVLSDTHMKDDRQCYPATMNYNIRDCMMAQPDYHRSDFVFISGDLFDQAQWFYDEAYNAIWTMSEDFKNQPVLCDGFGNHDIEDMTVHTTDIYKMLRSRNGIRKILMPDKKPDGMPSDYKFEASGTAGQYSETGFDLHYHITVSLPNKGKAHFIMLNLAPSDEDGTHTVSDGTTWMEKPYRAYTFLKNTLAKIGTADPVFLFYHVQCATGDFYTDYFPGDAQQSFKDLIFNGDGKKKYNITAIFNGHNHVTSTSAWNGIPVYICGGVQGQGYWEDPNNPNSSGQQSGKFWYYTYNAQTNSSTAKIFDAGQMFTYLP